MPTTVPNWFLWFQRNSQTTSVR